jgi:hypothetical protein
MTITTTGLLTWQTQPEDAGQHNIIVVARDAQGASAAETFELTVGQPQLEFTSSPPQLAVVQAPYLYRAEVEDHTGGSGPLVFGLVTAPVGMRIGAENGVVEWTPTLDQVGTHAVVIRVTNAAGIVSTQHYTLEVTELSVAPVISSEPVPQAVQHGIYVYDVNADDYGVCGRRDDRR